MAKDLRQFLAEVEAAEPDQILRVKKEVDPHFEVTGVLAKLEKERKFPVVIFERVRGSSLPVVTNVHADARRLFRAIGLPDATLPEFIREYAAREDSPRSPVLVKASGLDARAHPVGAGAQRRRRGRREDSRASRGMTNLGPARPGHVGRSPADRAR